jgi:hypothetical protein
LGGNVQIRGLVAKQQQQHEEEHVREAEVRKALRIGSSHLEPYNRLAIPLLSSFRSKSKWLGFGNFARLVRPSKVLKLLPQLRLHQRYHRMRLA